MRALCGTMILVSAGLGEVEQASSTHLCLYNGENTGLGSNPALVRGCITVVGDLFSWRYSIHSEYAGASCAVRRAAKRTVAQKHAQKQAGGYCPSRRSPVTCDSRSLFDSGGQFSDGGGDRAGDCHPGQGVSGVRGSPMSAVPREMVNMRAHHARSAARLKPNRGSEQETKTGGGYWTISTKSSASASRKPPSASTSDHRPFAPR